MYQVTDDSTQHGFDTPHGLNTPHRFPRTTNTPVDFFKMVTLLYPTGRAWHMPELSNFSQLHAAINLSLLQLVGDTAASLDSMFPDNINFDSSDCDLWEYRLGIEFNPALTTAQRRTNIYNALAFPQRVIARQHYLYIQQSLQDAGFNVNVYENIFFDGGGNLYQKTPNQVLGTVSGVTQFGGGTQFGGTTQFGGGGFSVIANSEQPENFSVGGILWPTFFISGAAINTPASIPSLRQTEFRRLVLKLKPAETVAFLIVNFT